MSFHIGNDQPKYLDPYDPYYPIGNSMSTDIIQGCRVGKECNILLLGCGDVRNILHTLHVLRRENASKLKRTKVSFHLNDIEDAILARDLILLHLIRNIDSKKSEDLKFLWAVWYEVILSDQHLQRLQILLDDLTKTEDGTNGIHFGNEETRRKLKEAIASWMKMKVSGQESIDKRTAFFKNDYQINFPYAPVNRVSSKVLNQYNLNNSLTLAERYKEEIRDYILLGLTRINRGSLSHDDVISRYHGNATFFRPGSDEWKVQDNCAPYMCYDPGMEMERYDGVNTTMSALCLEILQQWVQSFQMAVKDGCEIKIYLWLGEATAVAKNDIPEDLQFDFIDTSNISDRVGLIPVLVHFRNKLKQNTGVMKTEVYHWQKAAKTVEEFLRLCLDIPLLMYPTVLGLHLAEELTLGHEEVLEDGTFVGLARLSLRWRITKTSEKLTLTGTDAVSKALNELEHPQNPRETYMDCKTENGAIEVLKCEKSIRNLLRERVSSVVKEGDDGVQDRGKSKECGRSEFTINEFEDYYNVAIETDPALLKAGSISVTPGENDINTMIVSCINDGRTTFTTRLAFSCGISVNSSKIRFSRKRGLIECTLPKDRETTISESVLPWKLMKPQDVSALPDYPQSDFGVDQLVMNISCMYPKEELKDKTEGPPQHQLKGLMLYFLKTEPMTHGIPVHVTTGVASRNNHSDFDVDQLVMNISCMYPKEELKDKTEGPPQHQLKGLMLYFLKTEPMTHGIPVHVTTGVASRNNPTEPDKSQFLLEGLKIFEKKATTFLTWYDLDLGQRLVEEQKMNPNEFYEVSMTGNYQIPQEYSKHLSEGYELLKKVMKVNSFRMKQELPPDKRWKIKTFLRARYPFTDFKSLLLELKGAMNVDAMSRTVWDKVLRGEGLSDVIKELNLDQPLVTFTPSAGSTSTSTTSCDQNEMSCSICGQTTGCKRCTGCLKVYYCSRTCQGKDWSRHKSQCKKN